MKQFRKKRYAVENGVIVEKLAKQGDKVPTTWFARKSHAKSFISSSFPQNRTDGRTVPIKDSISQSMSIYLPIGSYSLPKCPESRSARKETNDRVITALQDFVNNGFTSPYVKTSFPIDNEWVKTNVIIHVPKALLLSWKAKPQKYSFAQFVQNVILTK